jgi:hypothetical protein
MSWLASKASPIAWLNSIGRLGELTQHIDGFGKDIIELIRHRCDSRGIRSVDPTVEERKNANETNR